jgi:hypothetical protein
MIPFSRACEANDIDVSLAMKALNIAFVYDDELLLFKRIYLRWR